MQNRKPDPYMTWMLCGLSILITLANNTSSATSTDFWSHIGHCTDGTPEDVWNGRYFLLISSVFLHANFLQGLGICHLAFNVYWLFRMGAVLEETIGILYYFIFWVAAAIVASSAELAGSGSTAIGASGVVYAVFGVLWAGRGRYPEWGEWASPTNIRLFIGWGFLCVVLTVFNLMPVANWAHAVGLAFGYAVGAVLFVPRQRWIAAAGLTVLVAISVLSVTYMPWSEGWTFWKAGKEFDAGNYTRAIKFYHMSLKDGAEPQAAWNNITLAWNNKYVDDMNKGDTVAAGNDYKQAMLAERHLAPLGDE